MDGKKEIKLDFSNNPIRDQDKEAVEQISMFLNALPETLKFDTLEVSAIITPSTGVLWGFLCHFPFERNSVYLIITNCTLPIQASLDPEEGGYTQDTSIFDEEVEDELEGPLNLVKTLHATLCADHGFTGYLWELSPVPVCTYTRTGNLFTNVVIFETELGELDSVSMTSH